MSDDTKGLALVTGAIVLFLLLFLGSNRPSYPDDYPGTSSRATPQDC